MDDIILECKNIIAELSNYANKLKNSIGELFFAYLDEIAHFERQTTVLHRGKYCPSLVSRFIPNKNNALYLYKNIICSKNYSDELIKVESNLTNGDHHYEFVINRKSNMVGFTYELETRKLILVCDTVFNERKVIKNSVCSIGYNEEGQLFISKLILEKYSYSGNEVKAELINFSNITNEFEYETLNFSLPESGLEFGFVNKSYKVTNKSKSVGDFINFLYLRTLNTLNEFAIYNDVYALSFIVENSAVVGDETNSLSLSLDFARESDCPQASAYSEERWNYAFWSQLNSSMIIDPWNKGDGWEQYQNWLITTGLDGSSQQDILVAMFNVAAEVGLMLRKNNVIIDLFKKNIPIIIHNLEYWDEPEKATRKANPNNEASDFFVFLENEY